MGSQTPLGEITCPKKMIQSLTFPPAKGTHRHNGDASSHEDVKSGESSTEYPPSAECFPWDDAPAPDEARPGELLTMLANGIPCRA